MTTLVVNLRHGQRYDIYIGRPTQWGNPYEIGKHGDRATVLARYEDWLNHSPWLLQRLGELRGRVLGCFCKPLACHGDILARLADALPVAP